jgi:hypothetical protein
MSGQHYKILPQLSNHGTSRVVGRFVCARLNTKFYVENKGLISVFKDCSFAFGFHPFTTFGALPTFAFGFRPFAPFTTFGALPTFAFGFRPFTTFVIRW